MYSSALSTAKQRGFEELFYITAKYHGNVTPSKIPKTYFRERKEVGAFRNEAFFSYRAHNLQRRRTETHTILHKI
jgi:hypothetical protein